MWHVISQYTGYLPSRFGDASLILTRALSGVDTLPQRWHICVGRTEGVFPYVTGAMFIENKFSPEDREKVSIGKILISFHDWKSVLSPKYINIWKFNTIINVLYKCNKTKLNLNIYRRKAYWDV